MVTTRLKTHRQITRTNGHSGRVRIAVASRAERQRIYRMRHAIYARELQQHAERPEGRLTDALDASNQYLVATVRGRLMGFVSVTPPTAPRFAIEKYLSRDALPLLLHDGVYEVRLLTVDLAYRGRPLATLLMYAAFRWVEAHGGTRILAMGRREVLGLYLKVGFQPLGRTITAGKVVFELMSASVSDVREVASRHAMMLQALRAQTDWRLAIPFDRVGSCYHGGAFWEAIGERFNALNTKERVINADVLDAWYPPAPQVISALTAHLPWLLRTSPPTGCEGLLQAIATARGVAPACLVPGAGSSQLIFLAFREWLQPSSRVLVLDPTYGEYTYVLEQVVRCRVDRVRLSRLDHYQLDPDRLATRIAKGYDLVVLVNPNSPTGQHVSCAALEQVLRAVPLRTRVWVDETYVDYVGAEASLERLAVQQPNIIICKSMSKVYALSGARVAYLCSAPTLAAELRFLSPPWAVSLLAQVAAVAALQAPEYYAQRYQETRALREVLADDLRAHAGLDVVPGAANFLMCFLPPGGPDAITVVQACRKQGLYLRDLTSLNSTVGKYAIRIAVKDETTNHRMAEILARVLHCHAAAVPV